VLVIGIVVALEEAAPVLRQAHRMVAVSGYARSLDQPLFAQVPQVTGPWISRAPIVVSEITTGDDSEYTDGRERPRFGAPQGVLAIAVINQFAIWSTWQVNVAGEWIRDLAIAFSIVAVALGATGIMIALPWMPSDLCRSFPEPRPSDRASSLSRSRVRAPGWLQSSSRSRSLEPLRPPRLGVLECRSSSRES
jgi:hypothetical protein